jgi:hypothetical protein
MEEGHALAFPIYVSAAQTVFRSEYAKHDGNKIA